MILHGALPFLCIANAYSQNYQGSSWRFRPNQFGIQWYLFSAHPRMHDTVYLHREMWCVQIVQHRLSPFVEISSQLWTITTSVQLDTSRLLTLKPGCAPTWVQSHVVIVLLESQDSLSNPNILSFPSYLNRPDSLTHPSPHQLKTVMVKT
jgi:hypothetical protein